jgi:hypothetical protein
MLLLPERLPGAPVAVLPCRAAAVHLDPQSSCPTHPRPSPDDRLQVAGPRLRRASPAHARLPAKGEALRDLAAGFGISAATAWRRTRETIRLLATLAPGIRDALQHAKRTGAAFVILDGTLVHIDRNQIDRPFHPGKHKRHGMNLQAIADTRGNLLWISGAIRGSIHDTAAARIWQIPRGRPVFLWSKVLRSWAGSDAADVSGAASAVQRTDPRE